MMKIYLDDERETPPGWTRCYWPEEVIELLKNAQQGEITEISLDHDLGGTDIWDKRTGYDVITWIEEQVANHGFTPPIIHIHTANSAAWPRMKVGVEKIYELHQRNLNSKTD
jgi:hypothetical protein